MGLIKAAIGDGILTSMWVFSVPLLGIFSSIITTHLGFELQSLPSLFITINVAALFLLTFSFIGLLLGGASFNPASTVSLYTAGLKPDVSLISMAVRFPIQAAGGVWGAIGIKHLMPDKYKHVLKGPYLRVDPHTGAIAEGLMSFGLCFAVLVIMIKGPKNLLVKIWMLALATVSMVLAGGKYTGPSLNPANAYGWAYVNNWHNSWDLFYVYWISPLIGGVFAALAFRFLFKAPPVKEKKA